MTRHLSPAEIAERYSCDVHKVLDWIRLGELRAINVASKRNGRKPRWRIAPADLAAFEAARSSEPPPPPAPRRRRSAGFAVKSYF